jgi:dienelactone hydrolase
MSHHPSVGPLTRRLATVLVVLALLVVPVGAAQQPARPTIVIRGHELSLHVYGSPQGAPVIVSSGDGGWLHLAPHVAEFLSARGFYVVGFDAKAYLESFTARASTLQTADEPGDYRVLTDFVKRATGNARKPILIGISEGAGLSVLAATDPQTKQAIAGVIALGLPDLNELGWRWKDSVIYLTHRVPKEPVFSAATIVGQVAPLPLAAIHSTHDEFVPLADVERILANAREPKRLWVVDASDHAFAGNLAGFDRELLEAIAWIGEHPAP